MRPHVLGMQVILEGLEVCTRLLELDYGADPSAKAQQGDVIPLLGSRALRTNVPTDPLVPQLQEKVVLLE